MTHAELLAAEREDIAVGDLCQMCRCALYGNGQPQMCRECGGDGDERETDPCDLSKRAREER